MVPMKTKNTSDNLSTPGQWSERWSSGKTNRSVIFNPYAPSFRDFHQLFQKFLPFDRNLSFVEVGCYPGRYLWYFNRYFGYQVAGIDYVEWCCQQTRTSLATAEISAQIICADLFKFPSLPANNQWDVVASFGLVEHFNDTVNVLEKHLHLLKPGGYLVIGIPNHHGLNGHLLKWVDREKYATHNLMSYEALHDSLVKVENIEILAGGYFGHLGFWNTGIYAKFKHKSNIPYFLVRTPLWILEWAGRFLPDSSLLSPNITIIARKVG